MDILSTLYQKYEKILLVNLKEDTFKEIKVNEKEKVNYMGINQWFIEFANSEHICFSDKDRFLDFANIPTIKRRLQNKQHTSIVYQRCVNSSFQWYKMSIIKTENSDIVLLIVENINDCWLSVEQQKYRGNLLPKCYLYEYIESLKECSASCGLMVFEYHLTDKAEIDKILQYYFRHVFNYDTTHSIAIIDNMTPEEFQILLSHTYNRFADYDYHLGAVWTDNDEEKPKDLIDYAFGDLEVNK